MIAQQARKTFTLTGLDSQKKVWMSHEFKASTINSILATWNNTQLFNGDIWEVKRKKQ